MEKSVVYLTNRSGDAVEAELWDDISDGHVELWRKKWSPIIEEARRIRQEANVPKKDWPQDLHWEWDKKTDWSRRFLAMRRFAITCGKDLQGLMLVNLTKLTARLPSQKAKDLAYIEFVSTAPWNRRDLADEPMFAGVGVNMVRVAVELSRSEGFRGRVGLHSLQQAHKFYSGTCGMTDLGPDTSYYQLTYFEMTEDQAKSFCS